MAIAFRELPWYVQALLFVAIAVLIIAVGEFVPFSPVHQSRANLDKVNADYTKLNQEVTALRVYERRYAEFRQEMDALQKQLDTLKTIVPDEKELDEFMRLVQGAALAANVQVRRLTAMPVTPRDYHFEMPFELQVDGPYYNVVDFFARLSRLSRIINIGDISFTGLGGSRQSQFPVRPGTTVTGTFTATTFFTKAGEGQPGYAAAKQPGAR